VTGCVSPPATDPHRTLAEARARLPERFAHQAEAATTPDAAQTHATDLTDWPRAYGDPRLNALTASVLAANRDLAIAEAHLRETRARAVQIASALWPNVDFNGFGAHEKQLRHTATPNRVVDASGVDIQASWEVDVFGGNTMRTRAARLDADALEANVWGVKVALIAETVTRYLELAGTDARLAVLQRHIALQEEELRLATGAFRAGLVTEMTVQRATAKLASIRAARPPLEQTRSALVHGLAVLAGDAPEAFGARFANPVALPASHPADPRLAPSELLARRPDLRAAQAQLLAAAARSSAARTDLLPKFSLSGAYGKETLSVADLATLTNPVYFIGASVTLPLFNAGRIRARIAGEDAKLDEAAAAYEQALLKALEDVENAYAAVAAANNAHARLSEAVVAASTAAAQAQNGFKLGRIDYAALLDVQGERLAAEDGEVQARTAAAVAYASLFRAFGGGWEVKALAPW
jgi:NodT family efflux transporter outer membrane factor (OMF) lipoprotein